MEKTPSQNNPIHNPIALLYKMPHSYEVYFDEFGFKWIKDIHNALLTGQPVLSLSENEQGSFFYQFVDFHFGAFNKEDFAKCVAK